MIRFLGCVAAVAGLIALPAGCSQVLGMEDGHLDSTLNMPAAGGASGNAAAGGVAVAAGGTDPAGASSTPTDDGGARAAAGTGDAGAAGGQPPVELGSLCDQYCAAVMSGCTGEQAQYIDFAACQASCADFPEGDPDARTGNSINCRLTFAKKAPSEPYTYCTWAGPGGDGKCGTNCEGFCTIMMQTCTEQSTDRQDEYFSTLAACQSTCEQLGDVGAYSATNASLQTGADHVQCRLYHVGAAIAEDDPITHCGHAMGRSLCFNKPN